MKLSLKAGTTSKTVNIFMQDSSSTTGAGLTGLAFNTASLVAYYALPRAAAVQITLATQTVTGAYSSGGFVEISSANMPGWYRFDIPDAAIAASNSFSSIHFKGATNLAPLPIEIELTAWDNQDAVRGGLTALPNVASGSAGAIPTTGTGANQISVSSGQVILQTGTGTGQLDFTSGVVKSNPVQWLSGTIPAVNVTGVPLVDLKYTLGTISPATAGSVRADAVTGAVGSVTGNVGGSVASVTTVSANAIGATSVSTAGQNAAADALLDRVMSAGVDSGADNTTSRTVRQALRTSRNKLAIAAGVATIYKEDDVTASYTAAITTTAGNPITVVDPT
jgi:hypothetical protein